MKERRRHGPARAASLDRALHTSAVVVPPAAVVSAADAHVAQCALDRGAPLLSQDAIVGRIAEHTPL